MNASLAYGSTFLLGSLHALEPGHGKTFLAANLVDKKIGGRHILTMGLSLLFSHFLLLSCIAVILQYFFQGMKEGTMYDLMEWGAPLLVMGFGLWLLLRYFRNRKKKGHECCHHHHEEHEMKATDEKSGLRKAATAGFITGLLPCPTAIAPLILSGATGHFSNVLAYILIYVMGMGMVMMGFLSLCYFARGFVFKWLENLNSKLNTHLLSAMLIIGVGVFYFALNMYHHLEHGAH